MLLQDIYKKNLKVPFEDVAEDEELVTQIQIRLRDLGYYRDIVDGLFGYNTYVAMKDFTTDAHLNNMTSEIIGATWAKTLIERKEGHPVKAYVTSDQATYIFGRKPSTEQLSDLNRCLATFNIVTPVRIRHFLAQCAHESGGLRWMYELASGDDYEYREDLGNIHPGDGRRYKGAGVIQLTGRYNYSQFARYIKDERVMEGATYVGRVYPFTSAGFWWHNNGMNAYCDAGATCRQISQRVNGRDPANGLSDREYCYSLACQTIF